MVELIQETVEAAAAAAGRRPEQQGHLHPTSGSYSSYESGSFTGNFSYSTAGSVDEPVLASATVDPETCSVGASGAPAVGMALPCCFPLQLEGPCTSRERLLAGRLTLRRGLPTCVPPPACRRCVAAQRGLPGLCHRHEVGLQDGRQHLSARLRL